MEGDLNILKLKKYMTLLVMNPARGLALLTAATGARWWLECRQPLREHGRGMAATRRYPTARTHATSCWRLATGPQAAAGAGSRHLGRLIIPSNNPSPLDG